MYADKSVPQQGWGHADKTLPRRPAFGQKRAPGAISDDDDDEEGDGDGESDDGDVGSPIGFGSLEDMEEDDD